MKILKSDLIKEFENLKKDNPNTSHIILNGKGCFMISTPHSVEQTREDKIKLSEPETALIALYFNKVYHVPCIIKLHNINDDANYDLSCSYKEDIANYIKTHDIKFVADLHQMASKRIQNICFGTGGEDNINLLNQAPLLKNIIKCFEQLNEVYVNEPFKASFDGTMAKYISSKLDTPAVQIEINSRLISDDCNSTIIDFEKVLKPCR